jgi:hypothetical protein
MTYPVRPGSSVVLDLPDEAYHAMPELSSSQAKVLLESPAKYKYWLGKTRPPKDEFDLGHAVHKAILGLGAKITVLEFKDYRTKAAQDARDAARAKGEVPMLSKQMRAVDEMRDAVLKHSTAGPLFEIPGNPEVSIITQDTETGVPIRARFDRLTYPRKPLAYAIDLKTSKDASPEGFARSIAEYGYDLQHEWYRDAYRIATGEEVQFVFVVVETSPPYLVGQYRLHDDFIEMGHAKAVEARRLFAECTESGIWPGYPKAIKPIEPPLWAVYKHEEKYG